MGWLAVLFAQICSSPVLPLLCVTRSHISQAPLPSGMQVAWPTGGNDGSLEGQLGREARVLLSSSLPPVTLLSLHRVSSLIPSPSK